MLTGYITGQGGGGAVHESECSWLLSWHAASSRWGGADVGASVLCIASEEALQRQHLLISEQWCEGPGSTSARSRPGSRLRSV